MRNNFEALHESDQRYDFLNYLLKSHISVARKQHEHYRDLLKSVQDQHYGTLQHVVDDFAEKLLLSQLTRQPGRHFFVTCLKVDLFGVHDSNSANAFIFGLREGHWHNTKDTNQLLSMLQHVL